VIYINLHGFIEEEITIPKLMAKNVS